MREESSEVVLEIQTRLLCSGGSLYFIGSFFDSGLIKE